MKLYLNFFFIFVKTLAILFGQKIFWRVHIMAKLKVLKIAIFRVLNGIFGGIHELKNLIKIKKYNKR